MTLYLRCCAVSEAEAAAKPFDGATVAACLHPFNLSTCKAHKLKTEFDSLTESLAAVPQTVQVTAGAPLQTQAQIQTHLNLGGKGGGGQGVDRV